MIAPPGGFRNHPIHLAQAFHGNAYGYHLSKPHQDIPGYDLDPWWRELCVIAGLAQMGIEVPQRLGLVRSQEDGEQQGVLRRRRGWGRGGRRRRRGLAPRLAHREHPPPGGDDDYESTQTHRDNSHGFPSPRL